MRKYFNKGLASLIIAVMLIMILPTVALADNDKAIVILKGRNNITTSVGSIIYTTGSLTINGGNSMIEKNIGKGDDYDSIQTNDGNLEIDECILNFEITPDSQKSANSIDDGAKEINNTDILTVVEKVQDNQNAQRTVAEKVPNNQNAPKTGDSNKLIMWIILIVVCDVVLTVMTVFNKKKSGKR